MIDITAGIARSVSNIDHTRRGERSDNLYRDRSQRAKITDTRDNQPRGPGQRDESTRQAQFASANGIRQKNSSSFKKGEGNRTSPVKSSDLRMKADVRDINARASRGILLADNSGKVYRPQEKRPDWSKSTGRSNSSAKASRRKATEPARNSRANTSQNSRRTSNRASSKGGGKQTTQPVNRSSSQQSRIRATQNRNTQLSSKSASTPVRRSQPTASAKSSRKSSRRQPSPVSKAPAQRTQPVKASKTTRQRSPGNVAVSPQRQNASRANTQQKRSGNSAPRTTAPVKAAPQKSTRNTNGGGSRSKSGSSRHSQSGKK